MGDFAKTTSGAFLAPDSDVMVNPGGEECAIDANDSGQKSQRGNRFPDLRSLLDEAPKNDEVEPKQAQERVHQHRASCSVQPANPFTVVRSIDFSRAVLFLSESNVMGIPDVGPNSTHKRN